ncbi:hypothetical protein [Parendozoicomonas haliclonae]|uniref:Uncharacterized protein n=1 Tax=Parendozoicomonas haliclonae TaxID=1960125 RepID=A0A1X7ALJ7_9GAMM|nr:hypothetical protein [Parendozoicomonas haliclonae]SMA48515.1 hypothetical protein EHSB41UT_02775 [Parendozoicomonas haliclonae]
MKQTLSALAFSGLLLASTSGYTSEYPFKEFGGYTCSESHLALIFDQPREGNARWYENNTVQHEMAPEDGEESCLSAYFDYSLANDLRERCGSEPDYWDLGDYLAGTFNRGGWETLLNDLVEYGFCDR